MSSSQGPCLQQGILCGTMGLVSHRSQVPEVTEARTGTTLLINQSPASGHWSPYQASASSPCLVHLFGEGDPVVTHPPSPPRGHSSGAGRGTWGPAEDPRRFLSGTCYLIPRIKHGTSGPSCTQLWHRSAFSVQPCRLRDFFSFLSSRPTPVYCVFTHLSSHISRHLPSPRLASVTQFFLRHCLSCRPSRSLVSVSPPRHLWTASCTAQ